MTGRPNVGLGRRYEPDDRDRAYPMRRLVAAERTEGWRYWWPGGGWFDQGAEPICVGASLWHWLVDGPRTGAVDRSPRSIYDRAQRLDEWPGETYDGTSVRGGAKALAEAGLIESYWWGWSAADVVLALLNRGPVVLGTDWHWQMFFPGDDGVLDVSGPVEGGHAYVANGVNTRTGLVRCKNSWGRGWGRDGYFWLRIDDLDRLLAASGEAMIAVEARP